MMAADDCLPRELVNKICRLLDIDSRRALNIYTRLKVPPELADKISKSLVFCNMPRDAQSVEDEALVLFQLPYLDDEIKDFYIHMMNNDMIEMPLGSKKRRVLSVIISWFENYEFVHPGVIIRAGIPDGQESLIIDCKPLEDDGAFILYGVNQTGFDALDD